MCVYVKLYQRCLLLIFLSTMMIGGCVGHHERWTAQGTTELEKSAFHFIGASVPIAEKFPSSQLHGSFHVIETKPSHSDDLPYNSEFDPKDSNELTQSSSVLDILKKDARFIKPSRDKEVDSSLNFRDVKGKRFETPDDVQAVVKDAGAMEYSDFQVLEQNGEQFGLVEPERPNIRGDSDAPVTVGPQMPNVVLEDEPLSVLWGDGETRQAEMSERYEVSQVPFPGIEAIALPGYSSEKEVENDTQKSISGQDDTLENKRTKAPILPIDDSLVPQEQPDVHGEDALSLPNITVKKTKDVTETTNENPNDMLSPSLSVLMLPDDRLKPIGTPQPRPTPREIITEEVVGQKKSALDRHEKIGRLHSDEEKKLSRVVVAEQEKPSAEENASRTSSTTSKLVLRKNPSESQKKKVLAPSEAEAMFTDANSLRANENSKKNNDIDSKNLVDKESGDSLTENPLPSSRKPSTFVNMPKTSVRKTNDSMALVPGQSGHGCSQGHTSLTRYQFQEVLAAFSRSIQTFLVANRTTQNNLALHDCYRQRASLYFQMNHPTQAISDIARVLEESKLKNIQRSKDLFFRGRVYASMNASQRVIDDVSEALQLGLDGISKAHAYYLRGLSYFRLQQFDAGLKDLSLSCRDEYPQACALLEKVM